MCMVSNVSLIVPIVLLVIAVKAKSKSKNRMVYASVEILEEQGYDVSKLVVT